MFVAGLIGAAVMTYAADADADANDGWMPPAARNDTQNDWIELKSGEWLKGTFSHMYEDSVEFDSDVLDDLTIDWDDIKQIRFHQPMGVRLDNRTVHYGKVTMVDGVVTFEESGTTAPRKDVVSIIPLYHDEIDRWELQAKLGLDFQSGNTDETRYTASIDAERRTVSTRLNFSYLGNYTKTDGTESANNHRVGSNFDFFFDERMFIRVIDIEYYRDKFQNLDTQLTIGAGVGYKIIDGKDFDWEIQAGPAYQYTEFNQVTAGSSKTAQSPAAIFSTTLDYDITDDLEYNLSYQGVLTNKQSGLFTQHIVTSLEYELTSIFDVFVMLQVDRVENPQARSNGSTPEQNDVTLSFGLGVDL
ncbi:DUF481 domain-containing protein [Cerasicoccus maritimus]|uniref:DUF481 domain-containing protein n=1 Tax=Cerasicoccus maritimus TaxID=490089 RepID=UPI002852B227|nr:DUF481 domain-containing protein [Cerasicoccus maritimus]